MTEEEKSRRIEEIEASGMSGPNKGAAVSEVMLPYLKARLDATTDKAERKPLKSRIRTNRMLRDWCKTRAGYRAE